jgi:hypothetical protein
MVTPAITYSDFHFANISLHLEISFKKKKTDSGKAYFAQSKEISRNRWYVRGGTNLLGDPDGTKMFPHVRNSKHNPRKRQPINKVHTNGDSQSKVA